MKIIQGAGRKRSNFKGSREPGTPPPYRVLFIVDRDVYLNSVDYSIAFQYKVPT